MIVEGEEINDLYDIIEYPMYLDSNRRRTQNQKVEVVVGWPPVSQERWPLDVLDKLDRRST